jgi:hypothetical protein
MKPFGGERGRETGREREGGREGEPGALPGPNLLWFLSRQLFLKKLKKI